MPYVIITNGTVGSGKTSLIEKTIKHYQLAKYPTLFLIDDLIEQNEHYKTLIDVIIKNECNNRTLCKTLEDKIHNPTDEMFQKFGDAYFETRSGGKWCNSMKCDEFLDIMLQNAITNGINMVFETTGTYYVDWLITKLKTYDIYYAFTILDSRSNLTRNKFRLHEDMTKYISDRNKPAPRLPNIRKDAMKQAILQNLQNVWNVIGKKMLGSLPDTFRIIVFDNSDNVQDTNRVAYDSDDPVLSDFSATIKKITNIVNLNYLT